MPQSKSKELEIERRKKISFGLKKAYDENRHRKISMKGEENPFFGKNHLEETKKIIGNYSKGKHPKMEFKKGRIVSDNEKNKKRESFKILWKDENFREKQTKLILNGLIKRPTSYEKKISELCIENNLPFIYTGNGTFLIGHKNPDFVNQQKRIAIEVYYSYYKIRDYGSCENYEKQRLGYFAKYGYKTIFIRDEEINDKNWKEICLNKIMEKNNATN